VSVADEQRRGRVEPRGEVLAGVAVELLHADEDREHVLLPGEGVDAVGEGLQVGLVLLRGLVAVMMK
jgi:hypothetical protein